MDLEERVFRLERKVGLRPSGGILPSGWDTEGHYWGDWVDPVTEEKPYTKENLKKMFGEMH